MTYFLLRWGIRWICLQVFNFVIIATFITVTLVSCPVTSVETMQVVIYLLHMLCFICFIISKYLTLLISALHNDFSFHSSFSFPSRFRKSLQSFEYPTYVLIFGKVVFLILYCAGTANYPRAGEARAVLHCFHLNFALHPLLAQEKYTHFFQNLAILCLHVSLCIHVILLLANSLLHCCIIAAFTKLQ